MSMKKLAVALSLFAVAGSFAHAKAPIISGVPDIVIGDNEDSLTIDNNWFRYVDAFNVLDYVTDVDSPKSDLLFAFFEENTSNDIGIRIDAAGATARTITQIDPADKARPVNWGDKEITNLKAGQTVRDYLLTFVDLVRSPEPYGGLPFPSQHYPDPAKIGGGTAGATEVADLPFHNGTGGLTLPNRTIWLYAADDPLAGSAAPELTRVTGDAMTIISRNFAFDALASGVSSVTGMQFNFANGAGTAGNPVSWTYSVIGGFAACTSGAAAGTGGLNGWISMAAPVSYTGTNGFGRWVTKKNGGTTFAGSIPYVTPAPGQSLIYCARYTMGQNQTPSGTAPQIRMGAYQCLFLSNVMVVVKPVQGLGAIGNPQVPDAGQLQTYKVVWSPMDTSPDFARLNWTEDLRTYNAFFDIFDQFNDQGGTWTLYNMDVVTAPRPADVTAALTYTNFDAAAGWATEAGTPIGTAVTAAHTAGGPITFNDAGVATNAPLAAYMWRRALDKNFVHWTDSQLLRVKLGLSCPTTTARANFHWFRMRTSTLGYNVGTEWSIMGDDGLYAATIGGNPYIPPATPGAPGIYEVYMGSQTMGPAVDGWTTIRNAQYDVINMGLDAITNQLDVAGTKHALPTTVTVHSVGIEVLADNL